MAQAVTIVRSNTVIHILKEQKGLKEHEVHRWIPIMRRINPHISDMNSIYPGESLLIPDTLNENVTHTRIWQNGL